MVKINITGFKEFEEKIKLAGAKIEREISHEVVNAGNEFAKLAKRDAPINEGQLRAGISSYSIDKFNVEVVSAADHSPYMEFGTKGKYRAIEGVDASQFRGSSGKGGVLKAITEWVRKKGIAKGKDLKSVAFRIMMSILINGVKPHPFFFKHIPLVKKKFTERVENILRSL